MKTVDNHITIKDFMECVDYEITGGQKYLWKCFGYNVRFLDSENMETCSLSILFDTENQMVYQLSAWDYDTDTELIWIHPEYRGAYKAECLDKAVSREHIINYIDRADDILYYATKIFSGEHYEIASEDVLEEYMDIITVNIPADDLLYLCMMAHERDITLNQLANEIIINHLREKYHEGEN